MDAVSKLAQEIGIARACDVMGVPRASFYRWNEPPIPPKPRPSPPRTLSPSQRQEVLQALNAEEFSDKAPTEIYATLLDREIYLCSLRTMYRILDEAGEVRERRDQLRHPTYKKPELLATGPNQVWSWDITKLLGPVKWTYFHLYVLLDIFSRYVVGWLVADGESAELAKKLIDETVHKQGIQAGQLTIHADRGSSMRSKPLALLYADLGITKSHSRPHVSDDNPYSEAQFKTLKYRPAFPERFGSLEDARLFCRGFFHWYNEEHRHWGIALLTPSTVHHGRAPEVQKVRQAVLARAYAAYPERFVNGVPQPLELPPAVWINPPTLITGAKPPPSDSVPQSDPPGSPRIDDLESTRPVAPPQTAPLVPPPHAQRGGPPSADTPTPTPAQPSLQHDDSPQALPINTNRFKPTAERSSHRRTSAELH
jgi:putative transposase